MCCRCDNLESLARAKHAHTGMTNRKSPLTRDEEERLERFLQWRRVEGRVPRSRWRWIAYMAAPMLFGAIIALGVSFFIGALTAPPGLTRERVASPPEPVLPGAGAASERVAAPTTATARRPAELPQVVTRPLAQLLERLKRWAQHAPDGKLGRAIVRWVQSPAAPDKPAPQPAPRAPQSR